MTTWLLRMVTNACALAVATWMFAGIAISANSTSDRALTLLFVALLFGVVNTFIRPVAAFLSLPLYLLTLGLMYFVVNALMLELTSWLAGAAQRRVSCRGLLDGDRGLDRDLDRQLVGR